LKARINPALVTRGESFGGVIYIPHRDRIFALDKDAFASLGYFTKDWRNSPETIPAESIVILASLGIIETDPSTKEIAYSGPGIIGTGLEEIPLVAEPLVVNLFCTSWCPLSCTYCHADDLMKDARTGEKLNDLSRVAATANLIPSLVRVVTGGDPLTRPARAADLIGRLNTSVPLVLDTSGVGDLDVLLPLLVERNVHVRVSLDSISPDINRRMRPANLKIVNNRDASMLGATETIEKCLENRLGVSIQSVFTSGNRDAADWSNLYRWIAASGVKNWIIHVAVEGGITREREKKRPGSILPRDFEKEIRKLWEQVVADGKTNLRLTDTNLRPNSVYLVGTDGTLFTEGLARRGKLELFNPNSARPDRIGELFYSIDRTGHAIRYMNWVNWLAGPLDLQKLSIDLHLPKSKPSESAVGVENELKVRVSDGGLLKKLLLDLGFNCDQDILLERDEYFDNSEGTLGQSDFVIRLRRTGDQAMTSLKGPRIPSASGSFSRVEIEFPTSSWSSTRQSILERGYVATWFLEKRREIWRHSEQDVVVMIDEVATAGDFVEIEGTAGLVSGIYDKLKPSLGIVETRNYKEIIFDEANSRGGPFPQGAEFAVT